MPSPRPLTVSIRGTKVKIKTVPHLKLDGEKVMGYCDYASKTIYLDQDQPKTELVDTLIHEILHFCCFDHDEDSISDSASSIAQALNKAGVLKDEFRLN